MADQEYDVIVVGAGSTGAALAGRLSDSPSTNVLLLEAGASYERLADFPKEILEPSETPATVPGHPANWAMRGSFFPGMTVPVARGKVIGGSSSINGTYFVRGLPENFAQWVQAGHDEWGYEELLPYFKALESDRDFDNELHGQDGPIAVEREPVSRAPEFIEAFTQACRDLGFPYEADKNAGGGLGVGPVPLNISNGMRISTAIGYLLPRLSSSNLRLKGEVFVRRILIDGGRAVGVEADIKGERVIYRAGEIVVSAGALRSPHLLMHSGIGPADQLREFGIPVVVDLPGVGQNMNDHPELVASYKVAVDIPNHLGRGAIAPALHWTAAGSQYPSDLEIFPFLKSARDLTDAKGAMLKRPLQTIRAMRGTSMRAITAHAAFGATGMTVLGLQQEASRGQVRLASGDPTDHPVIDYGFLSEPEDRRRMRELVKVFAEIFATKPMASIKGEVPDLKPSDLASDAALDSWIRGHLLIAGHPTSTCRMGTSSDPMAVVDQYGRVRGVDGLRVADTSIWPMAVSRGPNATAIMTGERIAAFMTGKHLGSQSTVISGR